MDRLRVLGLHGFQGTAAVLRGQLRPLLDGLESTVDFTCVDSPSLAAGSFGWWQLNFRGWQRSVDWLVEYLAGQPRFHGVFGFSQGAALTSLLVGLRSPDGRPTGAQPLSFDFAMMVGGFRSDSPEHASLYGATKSYELPSLHLMGRADGIVPMSDSQLLANQFADPVVVEHPGGHVIADTPEVRSAVGDFFARMARTYANGE